MKPLVSLLPAWAKFILLMLAWSLFQPSIVVIRVVLGESYELYRTATNAAVTALVTRSVRDASLLDYDDVNENISRAMPRPISILGGFPESGSHKVTLQIFDFH